MKSPLVLLLMLIHLVLSAQAPDIENQIKALQDSAYQLMQKDRYLESFSLLKTSSELIEAKDLKPQLAENHNILGLFYLQLEQYENAYDHYNKAAAINHKAKNNDRLIINYSNLLHAYVLNNDFINFEQLRPTLINILGENKDLNTLYLFETDLIASYRQGNFDELVSLAKQALNEIENSDVYNFDDQSFSPQLKTRFSLIFKMYYAFGLIELNQNQNEAISILAELENEPLKEIMWFSIRVLKDISRIYHYQEEYYRSKNNDALYKLYKQKEHNNDKDIISFLEKKTLQKNEILAAYIQKDLELDYANKDLDHKNSTIKRSRIAMLIAMLLILTITILFYMYRKANDSKLKLGKELQQKNEMLEATINEKNNLELKITRSQALISKDLEDSFINMMSGILSLSDVLEDMSSDDEEKLNSEKFGYFFNKLKERMTLINEDIKDIIWANKPVNNHISSIMDEMDVMIGRLQEKHGIKITFNNSFDHDYILPRYWNRQILLCVKKMIQFAVVQFEIKSATIEVKAENVKLEISCMIDGVLYFNGKVKHSEIEYIKRKANSMDFSYKSEYKERKLRLILKSSLQS